MNNYNKICIVLFFSLFTSKLEAMTIKMHGSGGIVSADGKTKVCPNNSKDICAIVSGPWWELLEYWWKNKVSTTPITLNDGTITFIDSHGREINYYHQKIEISSCNIDGVDSNKEMIEISKVNAIIVE